MSNWPSEQRMLEMYEGEEKSVRDISKEIDKPYPYVLGVLKFLGCETSRGYDSRAFSQSEAKEIRELYFKNRRHDYRSLAEKYEVSRQTIANVIRGDSYTDAGGPIKGEDY